MVQTQADLSTTRDVRLAFRCTTYIETCCSGDDRRKDEGDLSRHRYHAVVTCCDQTTFAPFRFVLNSNFVARGSLCGCHATR
jgi:hypothetical protein